MKIIFGLVTTVALSMGAFAMPSQDIGANLENTQVVLQDEATPVADAAQEIEPPVPAEAETPVPVPAEPPVPADTPTEADIPAAAQNETATEPAPATEMPAMEMPISETPSVMTEEIILAQPLVVSDYCSVCCCDCCCCPPAAPTPMTFCLVDPCGCSHQACINVPACCAGEQPVICWRKGFLRRQIATLTWTCCGHEVEVVVTCRGKVKVRG